MKVVEIFASIDGEGKFAGIPAIFIRLAGCNLSCSWCDSRYAWSKNELSYTEMSIDEIINKVDTLSLKYGISHITLTGGEPLIAKDVDTLIDNLITSDFHYIVNIETNGAVKLKRWAEKYYHRSDILFTMDWKCPSSGMNKYMKEDNLRALSYRHSNEYHINDIVKFVVGSKEDLEEVKRVIHMHVLPAQDYYISPVFGMIEPKDIVEFILNERLAQYGARIQIQLHKVIWDPNRRGV